MRPAENLPATGDRLAAIAEDVLPGRTTDVRRPLAGPPPNGPRPAPIAVYVAAPGGADTGAVLAALAPPPHGGPRRDLGGAIGPRLARWERDGRFGTAVPGRPALIWCPVGHEGLAVTSALALGRLAALLCPRRVAMLWFGVRMSGGPPGPRDCGRAAALVRAAVPGAEVRLHCVGWKADPRQDLQELARRFL